LKVGKWERVFLLALLSAYEHASVVNAAKITTNTTQRVLVHYY
jgi:hypothetical protein